MRPLILITNDDGIQSKGLVAAAQAVAPLGEILICAPLVQQSGIGRAYLRFGEEGIITEQTLLINGVPTKAFAITGSPAQAAAHGILELAPRKPDLCISGINYGENIGKCLTCSGTVGAALEADSMGIPAIAVSLQVPPEKYFTTAYEALDFEAAKASLYAVTKACLEQGMPKGATILNLNIPSDAKEGTPIRFTRQGGINHIPYSAPKNRDYTKPFALTASITFAKEELDPESDIYAIYIDRVVSLTPISWDLTASYDKSSFLLPQAIKKEII